ncbi:hypothetical protein [Bacteroides gallinarum]|uniref:hypothetical protein n=1 Tax=Bacteroides gallinarum TaxID=376806 RepID=UPI0003611468|nr:hypothetical protein [Bacteroides gallinarum]
MKGTIISIGTGASDITESAVFENFGFELHYFLINRKMLIKKEEISIENIINHIQKNAQKIILFSTLGGTCNEYIPQITDALVKNHLKYDAVVTLPFLFEGKQKQDIALKSIYNIIESCNSISIFNNEKLHNCGLELTVVEAFKWMDKQIVELVEQIMEDKLVENLQNNKLLPLALICNSNFKKFVNELINKTH